MLSAGAGGAELIDPVIFGAQVDFDVFRFGHDGDGGGGGVDASLGFGFGDALDAVPAALVLQVAVDVFAFEGEGDFFEAPHFGGAMVHDFGPPTFNVGVPPVHFVEVAGEEGGFFAAGAGADFHDAAGAKGIFAPDCHRQEFVPDGFASLAELDEFGFGEVTFFGGISGLGHFLAAADVFAEFLEFAVADGEAREAAVFAHDRRHPGPIGEDGGVGHFAFELLEACVLFFEGLTDRATHRDSRLARGCEEGRPTTAHFLTGFFLAGLVARLA